MSSPSEGMFGFGLLPGPAPGGRPIVEQVVQGAVGLFASWRASPLREAVAQAAAGEAVRGVVQEAFATIRSVRGRA